MHEFANLHGTPGCPTQDSPGVNTDYYAVTLYLHSPQAGAERSLTPHSRQCPQQGSMWYHCSLLSSSRSLSRPLKPPLSDLLQFITKTVSVF